MTGGTGTAHLQALTDAARWRLLSLLLERPRPGWHEEVRSLAQEIDDPELTRAARLAEIITEGSYLAVFGPGGSVSPREVGYLPMSDPGHVLSELESFYRAFSYEPRSEDPLDHVAVETGFVGYLLLKLSYARAAEDPEAAEVSAQALADFLDRHLKPFALAVGTKLAEHEEGHLLHAGAVLVRMVTRF